MSKILKNALLLSFLLLCLTPAIRAQLDTTTGQHKEKEAVAKDSTILKKARYVVSVANRNLKLTDPQRSFLEEAFYDRYFEGVKRTRGVTDPVKVAEIKKAIHDEFSRRVYKYFGKEKSAEIIAWYYNYSNKKR